MVHNKLKHHGAIALVCVLMVLFAPYQALAQESAQAAIQARMDAQRDANGTMWFVLGCLFGIFPLIIAYAINPNPPAGRLMGKSPDYVATYTEIYSSEVKNTRTSSTLWGCLVGTAIEVVFWVIYFTAQAASLE